MTTRSEKEKQKQVQDKCQAILSQLLRDEDNKYCVDCDAKGPRWASWNLGIFLCIRCAGIHRNLGVHISKVKSVNLDTWTPEQVACLQQMGNSRARAVYEANLPDSFRRPHTDSSLEAFIRAKYEQKKYIAKEWVPPPMPKPAFEIEDDKKKSSEKKARSKATGLESPVPNAIPAPKLKSSTPTRPASSPTPPPIGSQNKSSNEAKATPKPSATVDLLGLDDPILVESPQNSDPFGSFLSAADNVDASPAVVESTLTTTASSVTSQPSSTQSAKSDEENFFTQTSQQESQKKQAMTKESILSLYGQSSAPHQPVYGMPGNMYLNQQSFPTQQVAMGYSGVPVAQPAPMGIVPNGMMSTAAPVGLVANGMMPSATASNSLMGNVQHLPSQPQQGIVGAANHLVGTNPFLNPGIAGIYVPTNMAPAGLAQFDVYAIDQEPVNLMWDYRYPALTSMNNFPASTTNPYFFPPTTQLPPQMANLSLASGGLMAQQPIGIAGPGAPAWSSQPTGHTLSTNLWQ